MISWTKTEEHSSLTAIHIVQKKRVYTSSSSAPFPFLRGLIWICGRWSWILRACPSLFLSSTNLYRWLTTVKDRCVEGTLFLVFVNNLLPTTVRQLFSKQFSCEFISAEFCLKIGWVLQLQCWVRDLIPLSSK